MPRSLDPCQILSSLVTLAKRPVRTPCLNLRLAEPPFLHVNLPPSIRLDIIHGWSPWGRELVGGMRDRTDRERDPQILRGVCGEWMKTQWEQNWGNEKEG